MRFVLTALCGLLAVGGIAAAAPEPVGDGGKSAKTTPGARSHVEQRGDAYYHLMRATFAARRGSVRDVLAEVRLAGALDPDSAALRAESAGLLLGLGQRAEAERLAREAIGLDPQQPTALRLLAELAARRAIADSDEDSRSEAIRLYGLLAEGPDADDDVLRILAKLKFQAGDLDGAVDAGRRLAERRRGDASVTHMIVQLLRYGGREAEALETVLDFLAQYADDETLLSEANDLARRIDRWEWLEQACAQRLELEPPGVALRRLRAEALIRLERYPQAIEELERALAGAPDDAMLLYQLTSAYGYLGRLADAADAARALAASRPDNPGIQAVLGDALARQRDVGAALEALGAALEGMSGQDVEPERRDAIRRRMVRLLLPAGRLEEAALLVRGFERPSDRESLELAVRRALAAREFPGARKGIDALRELDEPGLVAMLEGELFVLEGRPGRARARFEEAASLLGPAVWARVGEIWADAQDPEAGLRAVRGWAREQPDSAEAHFALGGYLERIGRFEEAEGSLRRAFTLDPEHANALNYLGYSLADRNERLPEALSLIRRALEIDPWNGAYLDSLGWVYFRMGRFAEAREPLERAAREYPQDPTVLDHLGDLYARLGQHARALDMWRRALRADPDDPEAIRGKIDRSDGRVASPTTRIRPPAPEDAGGDDRGSLRR